MCLAKDQLIERNSKMEGKGADVEELDLDDDSGDSRDAPEIFAVMRIFSIIQRGQRLSSYP